MKRVLAGVVVWLAVGVATACSDGDDGPDPASTATGGSGAGTAGSGGTPTGGSSGATSGGSSGAAVGGSAGAGTAGSGGTGGTPTGGSSGAGTGGSAGAANGGQSGSSGSGGSGGKAGGDSLSCLESATGCLCAPVAPLPDEVPICTRQSVNGICCNNPMTGFCSCRTWTCENDSLGCSCGAGVEGTASACNGVYGVCCLSVNGTASSCYCDDVLTECIGDNDVEVENCEVEIAPCDDGEQAVETCKG